MIVATIAFGMGINKSNIRFIIHGDLPKSMEGYYQETGRAGRDGLESDCLLLFSTADIIRQQYFINQMENPVEQQKGKDNLSRIVRFAQVHVCRRKQIPACFGEEHPDRCGRCDVCAGGQKEVDATDDAQKLLSAIARTGENFGVTHIIGIVRGSDTERIRSRGHQYLPTYGIGKDKSLKWWRGIVTELIGQEKIYQDRDHYQVLKIREAGKEILFGRAQFFISELTACSGAERGKQKKSSLLKTGHVSLNKPDPAHLAQLKLMRRELSKKYRVPPYIIFTDKTLTEMAIQKPVTAQQLLEISGVGEQKLKKYGSAFLAAISG